MPTHSIKIGNLHNYDGHVTDIPTVSLVSSLLKTCSQRLLVGKQAATPWIYNV